jgi:hypothetical protein
MSDGISLLLITKAAVVATMLVANSLMAYCPGLATACSRLIGIPTMLMAKIVAMPRAHISINMLSEATNAGGTSESENSLTVTLPLVILGAIHVSDSHTRPIVAIKVDIKTSS